MQQWFRNEFDRHKILPLNASILTPTLSPHNHWYFFKKQCRQYTSRSLLDSVHHNWLNTYLHKRDKYREKDNLPPIWQSSNIPLTSEQWQFTRKINLPITLRSTTLRQILVWAQPAQNNNELPSTICTHIQTSTMCRICRSTTLDYAI